MSYSITVLGHVEGQEDFSSVIDRRRKARASLQAAEEAGLDEGLIAQLRDLHEQSAKDLEEATAEVADKERFVAEQFREVISHIVANEHITKAVFTGQASEGQINLLDASSLQEVNDAKSTEGSVGPEAQPSG